jgi:hypothetical protein
MMKKLFEMVENNNYNDLKQIIVSNPTINLGLQKSRCSLLYTSVRYRAKECFDILVEIPSVISFENGHYNSALSVAIEYYINGRNQSNKYYIDRLLENKMKAHNVLFRSIKDKNLFLYLYDKVDKTNIQFLQIVHKSLEEGCMDVFECMVDTAIGLNQLGVINGINIVYEILNEVISKDNTEALDIIMKYNINIKGYSFLLYNAITYDSINTFNYFYNIYSKMSKEDLNNIPNVTNIRSIFPDNRYKSVHRIKMISMILKLGIKFVNVSQSISELYIQSLNQYPTYSRNFLELYGYDVINLLFENKLILTNPITHINFPIFSKVLSRTFTSEVVKNNYFNTIAKFFDICSKYNFKPTDEVQNLLQKYKIPVK